MLIMYMKVTATAVVTIADMAIPTIDITDILTGSTLLDTIGYTGTRQQWSKCPKSTTSVDFIFETSSSNGFL